MSDGTTVPALGRFLLFVVIIAVLVALLLPVVRGLGALTVLP